MSREGPRPGSDPRPLPPAGCVFVCEVAMMPPPCLSPVVVLWFWGVRSCMVEAPEGGRWVTPLQVWSGDGVGSQRREVPA